MENQIQKKLALKMKLNKIDQSGIVAPILLNELLLKNGYPESKLVQGYTSLSDETCWHVWVETPTSRLDIGYTIACLRDKEFEKCTMILHTGLAPGSKPPQVDTETTDMWDLYKEDHKEFWKKQPVRIQNFRAKVLKEKVWSS